ncbi:TIGR04222 domain-containing membrane protein [Streptomyces amritsarensis]|uniref:TIGR04222 domain-containing membrane protein n=1 Tax=Streptomyces amritsarensis TaxID=681158 RepID=UPI0036CF904B
MNILAAAIWIAVAVSSVLLVRGLRRAGSTAAAPSAALHDLSEAAFLVGGPGTVVDTALVSMLGDGRLVVGGPGIVQVRPGARAADPAERAVLHAHAGAPSGWLYQVRYAAMRDPAVQEIGNALAARGLVAPPGGGRRWRRWGLVQAVACVVWLVASIPLTVVGFALDPDPGVPFVAMVAPVLLAGIVLGLLCMTRARNRVTRAGLRALRALRSAYVNDRTPHVQTALFGLRGLRDPFLRAQLVPAARGTRLAAAQAGARTHRPHTHTHTHPHTSSSDSSSDLLLPVMWCATSDGGGGSGSGCGSSGSGCGGGGSSGCSGGGGSSCGSSSGSGCSSSSSSSCSSSSSSSCSSSS